MIEQFEARARLALRGPLIPHLSNFEQAENNLARVTSSVWVLGLGLVLVSSCGSSGGDPSFNAGASCGPGTVLVNGTCVPAEAGGAGGESGAQEDAGGEGGAAGSGGGSGGAGAGGGSADAAPDAPTADGANGPVDDPCLDTTWYHLANCDTSCPAMTGYACADFACDATFQTKLSWTSIGTEAETLRLPSHPQQSAICASACSPAPLFAVTGYISGSGMGTHNVRISVTEPWKVLVWPGSVYPNLCADLAQATSCAARLEQVDFFFMVATNDPNAPASNVKFEEVPANTFCP